MKNNTYIYTLIALFLALSCVKEEERVVDVRNNGEVKTYSCFSVSFPEDSVDSKIHLDGLAVKWDDLDEIGIYSDMHAPVLYKRGDDGRFRGEEISGHIFYAVYPYRLVSYYDDNNPSTLSLPSLPGSDISQLPMVAKSLDNSLPFKQITGILRFPMTNGSKKLIRFEIDGNGAPLFPDDVKIDLSQDNPSLSWQPRISGIVFSPDVDLSSDNTYNQYIFLPEMEFPDGITVRIWCQDPITGAKDHIIKETHKNVNVKRAQLLTFSPLDLSDLDNDIDHHTEIIEEERLALIDLFQSLNGENWYNKTNWCTNMPVGEWYGVMTDDGGRVSRIEMFNNNLNGELPDNIGTFKKLGVLQLTRNGEATSNTPLIRGRLPESLGMLDYLVTLDLGGNIFSGTIPESLGNLSHLINLSLNGAYGYDGEIVTSLGEIEGQFPNWISRLSNTLSHLDLQDNRLSGEIPQQPFSELKHLSFLSLWGNLFSGNIPDFSGLTCLFYVDLGANNFSGIIPASFVDVIDNKELGDGSHFNFSSNRLSGIADEIIMHPSFSEFACDLLLPQQDGYKIEIVDDQVPACRHIFESFDGSTVNLGELYGNAEYTMIVRWAEWRPGFTPTAIQLSEQYREKGLQTVWAYAGGDEDARTAYMHDIGLDVLSPHIIESYGNGENRIPSQDHYVWQSAGFYDTPFIEIVNRDGFIVFIDDADNDYINYSFSHKREGLGYFLAKLFGGEYAEYQSTDYSADGQVHTLQTATKGAGINVVLMGDAFSDRLIADGTYESVMRSAANALFSEEPYKSFKDYFNVYYVDVVSKNEVYYGDSALDTWYGDGTSVGGDNDKVFEYAGNVLSDEQIDDALMIVMMNRDYYAGTCYMYSLDDGDYGRGPSVSYFPTSSDSATFDGLVSHEAGGHGFAKLADEYAYQSMGTVPQEVIEDRSAMFPYGWWRNGDFTGDPTQVKWSQFISDSRYEAENIGTYEGAFTYWTGAWRPTEESIMNHNVGGFNAPSRYAIWYRINKLAYGPEWQGTYEDFVEFDKPNRTPEAIAKRKAQRRNYVEKEFVPLAPPVVIEGDWREIKEIR